MDHTTQFGHAVRFNETGDPETTHGEHAPEACALCANKRMVRLLVQVYRETFGETTNEYP